MANVIKKFKAGIGLEPLSADPSNPVEGQLQFSDGTARAAGLYIYQNGVWEKQASDAFGINYITNNDGESNTTGYSTYADAAATSPVDGTGGSPNITFTINSSSPLRGLGDFKLSKDAANRQGEGVSYDFSIDSADKAKALTISFDCNASNANYADGDIRVYIYDVTNATVIEPSSTQLLAGTGKFQAQFQTSSNSTSYRLILHVSSTNATAYDVYFDNISVGPSQYAYANPVTDIKSTTLTLKGQTSDPTKGSGSSETSGYRRVGNCAEIFHSYQQTNAGTAGSGVYYLQLPTGLAADTSVLNLTGGNGLSVVGSAEMLVGGDLYYGVVKYASAYGGLVMEVTDPTSDGLVGSAFLPISNATYRFSFRATVPIQGWGSSIKVSDHEDGRKLSIRYSVSSSTANTSFADNTLEIVDFDTRIHATHPDTITTGASWKFTAPHSGFYKISSALYWNTNTNLVDTQCILYKNGAVEANLSRTNSSARGIVNREVTVSLNKGDYIDIRANQDDSASAARDIYTAATKFSDICIDEVLGPSGISASETIAARYRTVSGQSIPDNAITILDLETKSFDTHGAVTTGASWKFTASASGYYQVNAFVTWANVTNLVNAIIYIYKNGSQVSRGIVSPNFTQSISDIVSLVAGDYVDIRIWQDDSTSAARTISTSSNSFVTINRIGL